MSDRPGDPPRSDSASGEAHSGAENENIRGGGAGAGESSSTALSVVGSGPYGATTANELLHTLSALMDTLKSERQVYMSADEDRRRAEIDNARLQAQLEAEQELRRRAEEELARLRADIRERRRRTEAELERIASASTSAREEARATAAVGRRPDAIAAGLTGLVDLAAGAQDALVVEEDQRQRVEAELEQMRRADAARRDRVAEELERLKASGQGEAVRQRVKEELERLLGDPVGQTGAGAAPAAEEPSPHHVPSPQHVAPQHQVARSAGLPQEPRQSPPAAQEAPLPPGWRYASELPPQRPRFRVRWGKRPPGSA
ncbi:MAG: hypothetical protein ABR529_08190 [Actinomycetota bacterium]